MSTQPTPVLSTAEMTARQAMNAIQAECLVGKADGAYLREATCEKIILSAINTFSTSLIEARNDQLHALGFAENDTTDIAAEIRRIRDEGRGHFHDVTKLSEENNRLKAPACNPTPAAPVLGVFAVSFFSQIDWRTNKSEVIAADEAQVREWADKQCEPKYRGRIRFGIKQTDPNEDSLTIMRLRDATLPYVIES